jgi:hypothetical protein
MAWFRPVGLPGLGLEVRSPHRDAGAYTISPPISRRRSTREVDAIAGWLRRPVRRAARARVGRPSAAPSRAALEAGIRDLEPLAAFADLAPGSQATQRRTRMNGMSRVATPRGAAALAALFDKDGRAMRP